MGRSTAHISEIRDRLRQGVADNIEWYIAEMAHQPHPDHKHDCHYYRFKIIDSAMERVGPPKIQGMQIEIDPGESSPTELVVRYVKPTEKKSPNGNNRIKGNGKS
jgi:hypothetical protein